jgi:hypothetical protein
MRRALVVAAFLVLLIIILIFLFNLGGRPGQAAPALTASATEATSPASAGPTAASAQPTRTSSAPSAAATTSAKTSTKPSISSSASARSKPSSSSTASASSRSSASSDPAADSSDKPAKAKKTSRPAEPAEPAEPKYAACEPDALRATIKSDKHNVGVGDKVDFELSVINGGANPCSLQISQQSYQLKIFSGTDRIWSSDDCAKIEPKVAKILQPEQQVEWSMTWNGKRSDEDANCRARPEMPRSGYYYATSAVKGAKPVQFLLILRG